MAQTPIGSYEHYSDEDLMNRCFELASGGEQNAEELAAVDAAIQARLAATYGATEPLSRPKARYATH